FDGKSRSLALLRRIAEKLSPIGSFACALGVTPEGPAAPF
ncbi:hypothetical protein EVA_16425, partial [gut metagenome]